METKRVVSVLVAVAVVSACLPASVNAAAYSWYVASGDWSNAANWDPAWTAGVPGAADDARVNTGTATVSNTQGTTDLWVGNGGTGTVAITTGSLAQTNIVNLGYYGTGTITQSGGSYTQTGWRGVRMGQGNASSLGVYNLSDGTASIERWSVGYGDGATGTVTQTGGTATVDPSLGYFYVGYGSSAIGEYSLSGTGSLTSPVTYIGAFSGATGTFNQSGGTSNLGNDVYIGNASGTSGTVALSNGAMTAGTLRVGTSGTGSFTQTGGTVTPTYLTLAQQTGSTGSYDISGGTLDVTNNLYIGYDLYNGVATMTVTGSAATISVGNDLVQNSASELIAEIGGAGISTINVVGGADLGQGGTLTVTDLGASFGTYNLIEAAGGITSPLNVNLPNANWSWGVTTGPSSDTLWVAYVPEPTTAVLVLAGLVQALYRRRGA